MFVKGFSIVLFGYGLMILVGVAMGNSSPYQPLFNPNIRQVQSMSELTTNKSVKPIIVNNLQEAQTVINNATLQHKKVLVDFYALIR